jgi:hypothetical protein
MARQLENWIDATEFSDPDQVTLLLQKLEAPFPLEWYRTNPRLAMDRLIKFDGNPNFTPHYDEGDF